MPLEEISPEPISSSSSRTLKSLTHAGGYFMIIILRNSQNTTNGTTSSNNVNSYSSTAISMMTTISAIYDIGKGGTSGDPPCSSHTVINDPSRNIARSGIGGSCDNGPLFNTSIGGRWIRFIGTGGTIIPMASPAMDHCGAYLAGWSNGTLPSIIGTIVSGD
ncbi:unnamed protein product, partial [Rotaria sordida]